MDRAVDKIEPAIPQDMKLLVTREAIAAIIVGGIALTCLFICCCCICLRCRRHAKRTAPRRRSRREVAREQQTSLVAPGNDFDGFDDEFEEDEDDEPVDSRALMRL